LAQKTFHLHQPQKLLRTASPIQSLLIRISQSQLLLTRLRLVIPGELESVAAAAVVPLLLVVVPSQRLQKSWMLRWLTTGVLRVELLTAVMLP